MLGGDLHRWCDFRGDRLFCSGDGAGRCGATDLVTLLDDLDQSAADETVEFGLDGARQQGMTVSDRGRIPREVTDAYHPRPLTAPLGPMVRGGTALGVSTWRRRAVMLVAVMAPVDQLMRQAVKARQRAQTAIGEAVREAQAAGWSWERMSSALGGSPSAETLRRTFAGAAAAEPGPGSCPSCSGKHDSCGCEGGPCR